MTGKKQPKLPPEAKKGQLKAVKPMLASLTSEPFHNPEFIYEIKHDGYRALAMVTSKGVQLYSRNMNSFNTRFPELVEHLGKLKFEGLIDGEIAILDDQGISRFQLMQNYLRNRKGTLVYYVFDLLHYNGYDLTSVPLTGRKSLLQSVIPETGIIRYSPHFTQGMKVFREAERMGLEGVIAKEAASTYDSGKRTRRWLKIKTGSEHELVIGGFTAPSGGRTGFGSLLTGVMENGALRYYGKVGTGFTDRDLRELYSKMKEIETESSPFHHVPAKDKKNVTWVKPQLVGQVRYTELTDEKIMRHPVFLGLRMDKKGSEVKEEVPVEAPGGKAVSKQPATSGTGTKGKSKILGVPVTNLSKVFWPEEGYTKGDVINYYREVAPVILPHLKDRPQSLYRTPDGVDKKGFFQKNMDGKAASFAETVLIESDSGDEPIEYLLCQDDKTLIYMANLGCIEINPWSSRIVSPDNPDFAVFDLDPLDIGYNKVVDVALKIRELLDSLEVHSFCKTSGSDGFHIYVPLGAKYSYEQSQQFVRLIETYVHAQLPGITSLERLPSKRKKKVYLDYLQNGKGKTMSSVYSLRPRKKAPVSTPLEWSEVKHGLDPAAYNIKTVLKRIEKKGDLWEELLLKKNAMNMKKVLQHISTHWN